MTAGANLRFFLVHGSYVHGEDAKMNLTPPHMTFSAPRISRTCGHKKTEPLMRSQQASMIFLIYFYLLNDQTDPAPPQ
jgi:hypothetical protein